MKISNVKKRFLKDAEDIISIQNSCAVLKHEEIPKAQQQRYDTLTKIMIEQDDPVRFTFKGKTIEEKSDSIMLAMSKGDITPAQGEKIMGILRSSYEIGQMSELLEKLQNAGLIPQQ